MGLRDDFAHMLFDGLQSRTLTNCSRWAMKRRVMTHPFPGPFSFTHHPWTREIHDVEADQVTVQKAAQLGLSETFLNIALFHVVERQLNVLYVLPSTGNAGDFSKSRFNPAIQTSSYLTNIFTDLNSISLKQCGNATLFIRGSRSDAGLKSIAVSRIIGDEIDEFSARAIALLRERSSGQVEKQFFGLSTPTIPNFGINQLYNESTQEHFHFECPSCKRRIEFHDFKDCVEIIGDSVSDPRCDDSFLKCSECKAKIPHEAKGEILASGIWVPTNREASPNHRGFYINQMYSTTITPGELVKAYYRTFGNEAEAVEFNNSKLGIPYIGSGARISQADIDQCIHKHSKDDQRPRDASTLVTMGVDQGKQLHIEICSWQFDRYGEDLNVTAIPTTLWEGHVTEEDWDQLDNFMYDFQIHHCCIDADPAITEARRFARRFPRFVTLIRFRAGVSAKEIQRVDSEDSAPIYHVDRSHWFSVALGRFRSKRILLPRDLSQEYRDHIQAPVRTYKKDDNGNARMVYVSTGADHLALARVYSEIALPLSAAHASGQDVENFL